MIRARLRACAGILTGTLVLSVASCSRPGSDYAPVADYFPLHTEDTWVYEVVRPLRNLRTRMTVRVREERYVSALQRRCRLVDESYATEVTVDDLGGLSASAVAPAESIAAGELYPIAYYRENGFLYRAMSLEYRAGELREIGIGSSEERFLPERFGSEAAWDSVTTAYDLGGGTGYAVRQSHHTEIESHVVSVPAGTFSGCIRVDTVAVHSGQHDGDPGTAPIVLYYADWYAPNVGLVRTVQTDRAGGGPPLTQIELLAYDVEGARR
jgi:hypothetical protein